MSRFTCIAVPGTGETNAHDERTDVSGMLKAVTDLLPKDRFDLEWLPYESQYGNPTAYAASVASGKARLRAAIEHDPNPVILIGYSQGAQIVGDLAAELHTLPHLDVRGVGLLSDPSRHRGQWGGHLTAPEGYGVCGERWIPTDERPVWSMSAQGDPISSLPAGVALRTLADWSNWMTSSDPQAWAFDVLGDITKGRMQQWWRLRNWRTWPGTLAFARGLLFDGRHTCYATEHVPGMNVTYCERLAELIIASVTP